MKSQKEIISNIRNKRNERQKWIARDPYEEVIVEGEGNQRYIRPFIQNLDKLDHILKFKVESEQKGVTPVPLDPSRLWRKHSAVFTSHVDRPKTTFGDKKFFDKT